MKRQKETPYSLYVDDAIRTVLQHASGFTLAELSEKTGLRITPSMRRRVKRWVDDKKLYVVRVDYPNGGSVNRYEEGIPF